MDCKSVAAKTALATTVPTPLLCKALKYDYNIYAATNKVLLR